MEKETNTHSDATNKDVAVEVSDAALFEAEEYLDETYDDRLSGTHSETDPDNSDASSNGYPDGITIHDHNLEKDDGKTSEEQLEVGSVTEPVSSSVSSVGRVYSEEDEYIIKPSGLPQEAKKDVIIFVPGFINSQDRCDMASRIAAALDIVSHIPSKNFRGTIAKPTNLTHGNSKQEFDSQLSEICMELPANDGREKEEWPIADVY
eukprot:12673662-Ditylum_brightwellii.AAC.1